MVLVSSTAIMDNNYEPSFEVVDKAEDAEDYLLAKNRRTTESTQPAAQKVAADSTNNNIAMNSDTATTDEDKMNFNGMNFLSGASDSNDVENGNVAPEDCNVLKCVTEDEEGQEALWLEEAETTPSTTSASASPAVNKSSTRRSSFLFGSGGGGHSKKAATISPKRTISFRKKKNPPKVMLIHGSSDANNYAPASVPVVSSDDVAGETSKDAALVVGTVVSQPDAVIKSDTISSLGFDKSFDVKSPLSMSSLNEILDAPLTPTGTAEESLAIVSTAEPNKKRTKKSAVRGMFRKKEKKEKEKKSFSFMNRSRYARSVLVVEKEGKEEDDADETDPVLVVTRDINERIQASLMRAMENDDAESLTSFTGVPMILKEDKSTKTNDKPKSVTILQGQKPLNFEKVKPTFVVSKDSLTMAEIQERFVPMYDDEDDEEGNYDDVQNLASPSTLDGSNNEGSHVEELKSSSPNSTGADSAVTDRYEVAQNAGDDNESDYDDGKSDKYSVLPDPCSFCDSFWVATDNQAAVSKTLSDSPDMKTEANKYDTEITLDSPVIDKYAELPEVVANVNDDDGESNVMKDSSFNKSTTAVASNRTLSTLFGKFKRPMSSSEVPETMVASSSETSNRGAELESSEPEEQFIPETTNNEPNSKTLDQESTEPSVVASKSSTSGFFGKFKKPSAPKGKSGNVSSDPTTGISEVESSMNTLALEGVNKNISTVAPPKAVPRKSILKKRKEVMMIPVDEPTSYVVPGNDLESPGAKISVLSLGSEPYVIPAAATSMTVTSKSTASGMMEQHPVEDPSTEGSSSADDEVANAKIVSIAPVSPTKSTITTDPLLTRLRKNLHKRRGLEPQTDVDPIISVGNGRTRLDP